MHARWRYYICFCELVTFAWYRSCVKTVMLTARATTVALEEIKVYELHRSPFFFFVRKILQIKTAGFAELRGSYDLKAIYRTICF